MVDQEVAGATEWQGFGANADGAPHGQEFTPAQDNLVGVDLFLEEGFSATNLVDVTVEIRKEGFEGPVLASVTMTVMVAPFSSFEGPTKVPESLVHFDFAPSVALVPGETYAIRVGASGNIVWLFVNEDVYSGGRMINLSNVQDFRDFGFRTYFLP